MHSPTNESDACNPAFCAPWRVPWTSATPWSHIQPARYCTWVLVSSINWLASDDIVPTVRRGRPKREAGINQKYVQGGGGRRAGAFADDRERYMSKRQKDVNCTRRCQASSKRRWYRAASGSLARTPWDGEDIANGVKWPPMLSVAECS